MARGGWVTSQMANEDREIKTCVTLKLRHSGEVKREVLIVDNLVGKNKTFYVPDSHTEVTLKTIFCVTEIGPKSYDEICISDLSGAEHMREEIMAMLKHRDRSKRNEI